MSRNNDDEIIEWHDPKPFGFVYTTDAGQRFLKSAASGFLSDVISTKAVGFVNWTDFNKTLISWKGSHRYQASAGLLSTAIGHDVYQNGVKKITLSNFAIGAAKKGATWFVFQVTSGANLTLLAGSSESSLTSIYTKSGFYPLQHFVISKDCMKATCLYQGYLGVNLLQLAINPTDLTCAVVSDIFTAYPIDDYVSSDITNGTRYALSKRGMVYAVDYDSTKTLQTLKIEAEFSKDNTIVTHTLTAADMPEDAPFPIPDGWVDSSVYFGTFNYITTRFYNEEYQRDSTEILALAVYVNDVVYSAYGYTKTTVEKSWTPAIVNKNQFAMGDHNVHTGYSFTLDPTNNTGSSETTESDTAWKVVIINDVDLRYGLMLITEIVRVNDDSYTLTTKLNFKGAVVYTHSAASTFHFREHFFNEDSGFSGVKIKSKRGIFFQKVGSAGSYHVEHNDVLATCFIDIFDNIAAKIQTVTELNTDGSYQLSDAVFLKIDKHTGGVNTFTATDLTGVI